MEINERLKTFRQYLGLSQKELADKLEMSERTIRNYETGKVSIPKSFIYALKGLFNLNPDWLLKGEGKMFITKEENISSIEEEILKILKEEDEEAKKALLDFLKKSWVSKKQLK